MLMMLVSDADIQQSLFSIHGDKSLGPYGFGTFFYKEVWYLVGTEIICAV